MESDEEIAKVELSGEIARRFMKDDGGPRNGNWAVNASGSRNGWIWISESWVTRIIFSPLGENAVNFAPWGNCPRGSGVNVVVASFAVKA